MISIYCESKYNKLCQRLLFDIGHVWYADKLPQFFDCEDGNLFVIFFVNSRANIRNGGNFMSYNTSNIIKDYVYFKEYFRQELRTLKLKRLV